MGSTENQVAETEAQPARVTAMAVAMQAVGGGLGWSLLPPLMPVVSTELGISHAQSGLVWGSASLGIALASPFGGAAVDRLGARRVGAAAMLVGALACALRVFAVGPLSLAATMLLFGAHVGFVAPALPKALAGHVPVARLARANGIALLGYTLGTALTVLVARTVLAPALGGWRNVMLVAAALMAVVAVLFYALVTDRAASSRHASIRDSFALAKLPELRRVAAMHFLLFGGYLALLGMLPRALLAMGLPVAEVGAAVAGWLVCAAVANYAGPVIAARLGARRPVLVIGATVAAAGFGALALTGAHPMLCLAIAALGGGCLAPILLTAPLEMDGIGPVKAGAAVGLLTLVGQVGGFLLPIATGALVGEDGHFSLALGALALVHLAIVVPAWGVREVGASARGTAAPRATVGALA